jgi:hypothetical protein
VCEGNKKLKFNILKKPFAIDGTLKSQSGTFPTDEPFLSQESLNMVYFSYFQFIMTYGLVFWGNSYHSNTVFKLQKKII